MVDADAKGKLCTVELIEKVCRTHVAGDKRSN